MPLHPQARALLDQMGALATPDISSLDPAVVRPLFSSIGPATEGQPVARVEEVVAPGPAGDITVRVYTPEGRGPFPMLVFFHGGGFVLCSLDTHDGLCRALANGAGCLVASVDYRLAPEAPFPAAPEDCLAATRWVAENAARLGGDPARMAVGGDSAGGNLAAVTALMVRDLGGPALAHQLLIYPVIDYGFDTPSYRQNAEGYLLSRDMMRWFWGHYLKNEADADDPFASPLRAPDLANLPPAHVITAEYDPLRDEGEAYAQRLLAAGIRTELIRYDGVFHGFLSMFEQLDSGKQALDRACLGLRTVLNAQ